MKGMLKMPIAFVYSKNVKKISGLQGEQLLKDWSEGGEVPKEYCTINFIENELQVGNQYQIMARIFLPNLWDEQAVKLIQKSLIQAINKNLNVTQENVFIMISLIHSGHLTDRGVVEEW